MSRRRQVAQITKGDHALGSWSYSEDNAAARLHAEHRHAAERDLHAAGSGRRAEARDVGVRRGPREVQDVAAGAHHLEGRRRRDDRRPAQLPGRLRSRAEVSADRDDARRPGGFGSIRLRNRDPGLRGEGLRGAASELSRQHGLRRQVPARHGEWLLQAGASRRAGRHRRRDRAWASPIPPSS